ncbi:MAG: aminotransferase [Chloroflexi bacterium]|nr:aminotransferase [Chloroflexota bacterium]|tara:strand:- start:85174 stop:86373 length:1200 start_codon:yes stop_codon:yes gene_type:complete
MSLSKNFSFESLYSKSTPPGKLRTPPSRGKYDFAVAYPDPNSLPIKELIESLKIGLEEEGKNLAIYPHPQGYPPLRKFIAQKVFTDRGIKTDYENIILGNGSGEHLYMIAEALLNPNDVVFTEEFVYSGTLAILRRFKSTIIPVKCDSEGMIPEELENSIINIKTQNKIPKIIYTIPTFQNPLGLVSPVNRRLKFLEISKKHNIPIVEDDCYADLNFTKMSEPAIYSLDKTGNVIYVGSFSKIIAPGVRLGYIIAQPDFLDRINAIKSGGGVNEFASIAIHRYSEKYLKSHIESINNILIKKRDAMLAALGENFGSKAEWSKPNGGLYIWLKMPSNINLSSLQKESLKYGVGFQPGNLFSPNSDSGENCARLCFGYNTPEEIYEGIRELALILEKNQIL